MAWHAVRVARLGLFSLDTEEHGEVLVPTGEMELRPSPPLTEPHDIWIKFLQERMEVAKYSSQDQISVFSDLLQRTLDIQVGRSRPAMSRHLGAAGTRFRLLNCGMSLLQGDVMAPSLDKHLLRRRIYSCCLDFFCADKTAGLGGL